MKDAALQRAHGIHRVAAMVAASQMDRAAAMLVGLGRLAIHVQQDFSEIIVMWSVQMNCNAMDTVAAGLVVIACATMLSVE